MAKPVTIEDLRDDIKKHFDALDKDGDGCLNPTELRPVLIQICQAAYDRTPSEEELNETFTSLDNDCDGKIDFAEYLRWCEIILEQMKQQATAS